MSAPEQRNAEMVHKKGSEPLQSTPLNAALVDSMLWLFFYKTCRPTYVFVPCQIDPSSRAVGPYAVKMEVATLTEVDRILNW